ncbi:unnamed protein product, partial [marine sediment metagenome]
ADPLCHYNWPCSVLLDNPPQGRYAAQDRRLMGAPSRSYYDLFYLDFYR